MSATEEKVGKTEMVTNVQGQKSWNKAKARARKKTKVELVARIREDHLVFLVAEIIYCGSARSGRGFARL